MDPKQLVEEVFAKTRVRIAEDDPVLAVVLLNEALVEGLCERLESTVRASEDRVSAAVLQQVEAARQALAGTVTAGAEHLAEEARRAAAYLEEVVKSAAAEHVGASAAVAERARRFMWIALTAAGLAIGLLAGMLAAGPLARL